MPKPVTEISLKPQTIISEHKSTSIKQPVTVNAVGDIMLGTDFPDDRRAPDDGKGLLNAVTPILQDADITFGNLEGVLLEGGESAKKCKNPLACYVFRSPPYYAEYLKLAGFDVMSLANNHARDFGEEGRKSSMATLDKAGIYHSGSVGDVASWSVGSDSDSMTSVAMIAFAPFRGAHDMLDTAYAVKMVTALSKKHDLVIVSMHGGAEGKDVSRIPFSEEIFYGENRGDVVAFSHAVVDAGADLVIGHGPHVPRALELYKKRLIAYSLGNFCTYLGIKISGINGWAPILNAKLSPTGEFLQGQIISTLQTRPAGNILDNKNRAAKEIARLTQLDFPGTGIVISEDGTIHLQDPQQHHNSQDIRH